MEKRYVKVISETDRTGFETPLQIILEDSRCYDITRVTDVLPLDGTRRLRFTVMIRNEFRYLYRERPLVETTRCSHRWYLEA